MAVAPLSRRVPGTPSIDTMGCQGKAMANSTVCLPACQHSAFHYPHTADPAPQRCPEQRTDLQPGGEEAAAAAAQSGMQRGWLTRR